MLDILICGCDTTLVRSLFQLLSPQGYDIDTADCASDIMQKILFQNFKVIILCLYIKGMDSLEVIPVINRIDPQLPIIIVADRASLEIERVARSNKIFYYSVKPLDPEELTSVVKQALAKMPKPHKHRIIK